jgi:hypothetical protein
MINIIEPQTCFEIHGQCFEEDIDHKNIMQEVVVLYMMRHVLGLDIKQHVLCQDTVPGFVALDIMQHVLGLDIATC